MPGQSHRNRISLSAPRTSPPSPRKMQCHVIGPHPLATPTPALPGGRTASLLPQTQTRRTDSHHSGRHTRENKQEIKGICAARGSVNVVQLNIVSSLKLLGGSKNVVQLSIVVQ